MEELELSEQCRLGNNQARKEPSPLQVNLSNESNIFKKPS